MNILSSPEVVAAVISIILGIIIGVVGSYIKSTRGNRIILSYKFSATLLRQVETLKSHLTISYEGDYINKLLVYGFTLQNHGLKDVSNLELRLLVKTESDDGFIDLRITDYLLKTTFEVKQHDDYVYEILICRPFINSTKRYKEESIDITIFSNEDLKFKLLGGGEGWYSKIKVEEPEASVSYFLINFLSIGGVGILMFALALFFPNSLNFEIKPTSVITMKYVSLFMGVLSFGIYFIIKYLYIRKREKKSLYF